MSKPQRNVPLAPLVVEAPAERAPTYVVVGGSFVCVLGGQRRELAPGSIVPAELSAADLTLGLARGLFAAV